MKSPIPKITYSLDGVKPVVGAAAATPRAPRAPLPCSGPAGAQHGARGRCSPGARLDGAGAPARASSRSSARPELITVYLATVFCSEEGERTGRWRRCARARLAPHPYPVAAPPALSTPLAAGGEEVLLAGGGSSSPSARLGRPFGTTCFRGSTRCCRRSAWGGRRRPVASVSATARTD